MSIRDYQYSDYSQDFLIGKPTIETFAILDLKTDKAHIKQSVHEKNGRKYGI